LRTTDGTLLRGWFYVPAASACEWFGSHLS
jgi:hypothetical protein